MTELPPAADRPPWRAGSRAPTRAVEKLSTPRELERQKSALEWTYRFLARSVGTLEKRIKQLTAARDAALLTARLKSRSLANLSHEIRTPMTAILGYVDLLSAPDTSEAERREYLETIRRNGEHLLRVLDNVLDLSKIGAGKMTLERKACSPVQLMGEVAALMRHGATERGLTLEVEYRTPIPARIGTDPTRFRQILVNLVGNAVKFTERGGVRVVVSLVGVNSGRAPRLCVEVSDTGIGLTAEGRATLFAPFTQADRSITRRFGGTGLGLAVSKQLAELLGGDITVESNPGEGTTFTLTIDPGPLEGVPMLKSPTDAAAENATPPAVDRDFVLRGRILLAEDTPDIQRLIAFFLRKAGAEVTLAEDGLRACALATAAAASGKPFDVILMDMQMPELDGYGATTRLRAGGYGGSIVALTAHSTQGDRWRCLAVGCDGFVSKPIDRRTLLETVQRHAARAAAPRPPAPPAQGPRLVGCASRRPS